MMAFELSDVFDGGLDDFERLHTWLDTFQRENTGLDEKAHSRIRLALAEAFSNAVRHAHGGAAGRPVGIRISFIPGPSALVRLDVTDDGPGFTLEPMPTPHEDEERGRGLMILHALCEKVEYQGNTLTLWLRS